LHVEADVVGGNQNVDADKLDRIENSLIRVETDMEWVKESLSNHLAHHNRFLFLLIAAVLALAGALIAAVVV